MKKYKITASVRTWIMVDYEVEAESEEAAERQALMGRDGDPEDVWASDLWQKPDWAMGEIDWCGCEDLQVALVEEVGS